MDRSKGTSEGRSRRAAHSTVAAKNVFSAQTARGLIVTNVSFQRDTTTHGLSAVPTVCVPYSTVWSLNSASPTSALYSSRLINLTRRQISISSSFDKLRRWWNRHQNEALAILRVRILSKMSCCQFERRSDTVSISRKPTTVILHCCSRAQPIMFARGPLTTDRRCASWGDRGTVLVVPS